MGCASSSSQLSPERAQDDIYHESEAAKMSAPYRQAIEEAQNSRAEDASNPSQRDTHWTIDEVGLLIQSVIISLTNRCN
jgi:hypothetical protein